MIRTKSRRWKEIALLALLGIWFMKRWRFKWMSQAWIVTRSDHTQRVFPTDITRNISLLRCIKAEINVIPNVTWDLYIEIITYRATECENVATHLRTTSACKTVRTYQQEGKRKGDLHFFYNTVWWQRSFLTLTRECSQGRTTTNISPEFHSTSARITRCFRQKLIKMTPTESS